MTTCLKSLLLLKVRQTERNYLQKTLHLRTFTHPSSCDYTFTNGINLIWQLEVHQSLNSQLPKASYRISRMRSCMIHLSVTYYKKIHSCYYSYLLFMTPAISLTSYLLFITIEVIRFL